MKQATLPPNSLDRTDTRQMLERFLKGNLSLLALYLLSRRQTGGDAFIVEDLCIFIAKFLMRGRSDISSPIVIDEVVYNFVLGRSEIMINVLYLLSKNNYLPDASPKDDFGHEEFYFLRFLFHRKLYHLTNLREKHRLAQLCDDRIKNKHAFGERNVVGGTVAKNIPSILDGCSSESIQKIIDMQKIAARSVEPIIAITIFGFHRSMMGLGEDARRMFDILTELGYRVELFDCSPSILERDFLSDFYELFETTHPSARIILLCMPVFEMGRLFSKLPKEFFLSRYVIGYWPWELTEFPSEWSEFLGCADEIWASSRFLHNLYSRASSKPVYYVPLCVEVEKADDAQLAGQYLASGRANFISVFDFNSTIERKNPLGAIKAFRIAFDKADIDSHLILKSIHGNMNKNSLSKVLQEIGNDPRITLIDGAMSKSQMSSLIGAATAFVSLHRSEGFGRLLVESMLLRTPVIATNWSGSQDFVMPGTGFPVRCRLRSVEVAEYPYAAGEWAEPDLINAAEIMNLVARDRGICRAVAEAGFDFASSAFSRETVKAVVDDRMKAIAASIAA